MPESAEQLFERLFGKPAKGGDASPSGETAEQLFGRLYGSAPTPAAVEAPPQKPESWTGDEWATLQENEAYWAKKGHSITQLRDEAERDLVAEREAQYAERLARHEAAGRGPQNALQTMGVTSYAPAPRPPERPAPPTAQEISGRAHRNSPEGQARALEQQAEYYARFWHEMPVERQRAIFRNSDGTINTENVQTYLANVDEEIRQHAYSGATRPQRVAEGANPLTRIYDVAASGGTGRLEDLPLDLRRSRMAAEKQTQDDPMASRLATGAASILPVLLPGVGTAKGMALTGAAGNPDNPIAGAVHGATLAKVGGGLGRAAERIMPGLPVAIRAPLAQAATGPLAGAAASGVTGQEYGAEQAVMDALTGAALSTRGLGARVRAENFGLGRAKVGARKAAEPKAADAAMRAQDLADAEARDAEYREVGDDVLIPKHRELVDDWGHDNPPVPGEVSQFTDYGRGPKPVEVDAMGLPVVGPGVDGGAPSGTESSPMVRYGREPAPVETDVFGLPVRGPGVDGGAPSGTESSPMVRYGREPAPVETDVFGLPVRGPGVPGGAPSGTKNVSPVVTDHGSTRGIGRARKPARTMTEQEAGQVKQTYLAKGGDPDKVLSPERVADAARGEKPKDRVVGKRIVKGYVPSTDPVGDGLVEQGAEAAVEKAVELGVAPVSSGVDAKTGEGYVVGQAESGKVVEVRAAPQPDVAAPRLPEKAPTITREQAARANTAREALRAAINNPDLVGRQRADTIENLRNLTVFLDRTASKNLKSGVEFGDPVAYTGEDAPPGMRHFIYLEGAKAGRYGVAPTPEARAESVAKSKTEWREQQADFRKLREPTPAPDVAAPARGVGPRRYTRPDGATFEATRDPRRGFWRVRYTYDSRGGYGRQEGTFNRKNLDDAVEEMGAIGRGMNPLAVSVEPPQPDVAAPRPPGKAAGGDTAPRADVPVKVNRGAAYLREIRDADKARAARPPPKRDVVTPADDAVIGKNAAGELLYERADGSRYRINPRNRPGRQADFGGDLAPVEPDAPSGDFDIDPATGLPNYLSHVKPSKPLKPGPMRRMDNPERGTVDIGPAIDTAKEVGGLGTGGAKWVAKTARAWLGKASDSVRGLGGDGAGDALADDLAKSRQLASDYEAEHTDRLVRVRRGFSKGSVARAAQMPAAETADGASLRGREIIEGRLAPNADEAGVYGEYGQLLADTWNHQDRLGLTRGRPIPKAERDAMKAAEQAAAEAEDRPVRPTPKTRDVPMGQIRGLGKTLPDAPNQLLRHIYKKGGEWFETLVRATQQKHADADPAEVREYLEGKREEFNRVGALNPEGHMASEFVREYGLPDFLRIDGELVPIQETSMFKRATSLVSGGANVVGQRLVFGSGNKSTVAERRKAFEATGDEVAFDRAMRSGYGIGPFHSMRGLPPTPSSVKGLVGLTKGLALTASPIYNTTDTVVGNPSKVTGIVRGLRGVGDAFLNLMHRAAGLGETKRMRDLEAKGFRNRNVIEWALDPHAGKAWGAITGQKRLSRAAGVVGELAGGLGRAIKQPFSDAWNQFQEDAAASSLERWTIRQAKDVIGKVSGGSREYHVEAFQEVGLSRKDAEALVDGATSGKMTPDELATTLHRLGVEAVSATTASNIRPSATSLAEHLPGFRLISMFPRFAMANVRFSGRSLMASMDGWSKALKDPSLTRGQRAEIATAANARFAEFLVRAAVQGAAFKLFASGVKSLFGNDDGEIEKMMDDPEAYAAKAIADATTGGPVSQGIMAVDRGSVYLGGTVPGRALDTWRVVWNGVTLDLTEAKAMLEKASPLYKSITGGENTKEQRAIEREEARDDEPAKGVGGSYRRSRGHSSTFRGR